MSATSPPGPAARVLGVPIWGLTLEGFVDLAVEGVRSGRRSLFTTANAHSIVVAQRVPVFLDHFQRADVVLPDGFLPSWAARRRGGAVAERVAGPDFTSALLDRAAREMLSVFFLGATDETLARIVERCRARLPALRVAGTLAPPFGDFDPATDRRLMDAVNAAAPDLLFVGMTAPRQELFLSRIWGSLRAPMAIGVGAAFDYLAGNKRRVPRAVGQAGLEWAFRLAREPRRLWRRNFDSFVFLWLLARERR